MDWSICFFVSVILFLGAIIASIRLAHVKNKKGRILNTVNVLVFGTFLSAVVMFLPIYDDFFSQAPYQLAKKVLLSIHNAIRLFIVDGEFTIITDYVSKAPENIRHLYSVYAAAIFVIAPVLTFGFVLSFFKNLSAYRRYLFGFFKEVFVFSELNDKSVALATSLKKNNRKRLIIFTDVFEKNDEVSYEQIEQAREIQGICFKKDIQVVNFKLHSRKAPITFFAIGNDETENINQSLKLIDTYVGRDNTNLYVFTNKTESDLLLTSQDKGKVKVRRVNDVRSLINRILFEDGKRIFDSARQMDEQHNRLISAVIVGLGQHGSMMTKSLAWFGQMDGYDICVHAFDHDEFAGDKFNAQCPELMDQRFNGSKIEGEAHYEIKIHAGIDVESTKFTCAIQAIPMPTYILVALGNDETNIQTAVYLRSLYERIGCHPIIQSIVYSSAEKTALRGACNFKKQEYDIEFIGNLDSSYSEEVIIDSELENAALHRHLKWGSESEFWKYEYNYRSSIAAAIHKKMKILCGMPGIEKDAVNRTNEELWTLRRLEHRRWNAYMRSEGYSYAPVRNDLAKTHNCLVPFNKLSEKDQVKDDD